MGTVVHWEMFKRLRFDLTNKWYMHKLEFILENEMNKFLRNFGITQSQPEDQALSQLTRKKNLPSSEFCRTSEPQSENEKAKS